MPKRNKTNKTILLTGGSGILGTELQKLHDFVAPDLRELDIRNLKKCVLVIKKYDPDIILHAAAYTDVAGAEKDKKACWEVNVTGTENLARAAASRRLVLISTDYVFDGTTGNYRESDVPNPINFYALTKLISEVIIKQYPHTLIIRTAFKPSGPWPYPRAFVDQFGSHDFVENIAPDILRAALMEDLEGVIHITGERKSIYDLAKRVTPTVGKMKRSDVSVSIPYDTSLNTSTWKKILSESKKQKK